MSAEHFDVIIMGAGLSGIGAGYRLQTRCPGRSYAIFEARSSSGGTWDLFRYPGVRSDSDMFTLGYPFRPWKEAKAIADGTSILNYVRNTAREFGIDRHIRYNHRVSAAAWSSAENRWHVTVRTADATRYYTCNFLYGCTGYYRYDAGYQPAFPGIDSYRGTFVHPQKWPEELDYRGKRVVVIGSGATAVTLVPAMSETAAHVTMLQRSPTYILTLPAHDPIADAARRWLPERTAHSIVRWKNILIAVGLYQLARRAPEFCKCVIKGGAAKHLPPGYDVDTHFSPRYSPWDQRLCLVPDADLFRVLSNGSASIATGEIDTFTSSGVRLKSGEELPADVVVSATGLRMLALGGVQLSVDGVPVDPGHSFVYKGVMLSNVPNFAFCVGYTNASWTLRADLSSLYVTRILNHMQRHHYHTVVPTCDPAKLDPKPLLDFNSGYVLRAIEELPKQAAQRPWFIRQNYLRDAVTMKLGRINDGVLHFRVGSSASPS
jgi:cation diffusion facilitator CzcD-associated flavoprotein CzcO